MRLVYARDNDLTYNSIRFDISLQNFKKPLDICNHVTVHRPPDRPYHRHTNV